MAIGTCVFKGPVFRPFPGLSPLQPHPIPENQWVTVVDWSGVTAETLVHRVTVQPPDAVVKWRRRGLLGLAASEGTFQQQVDINVYPTDTNVSIELWVDDPNVSITVTYVQPMPPPSP